MLYFSTCTLYIVGSNNKFLPWERILHSVLETYTDRDTIMCFDVIHQHDRSEQVNYVVNKPTWHTKYQMSIEIKKWQKPDGRERTLGTCLPIKQSPERKDKTWANQM